LDKAPWENVDSTQLTVICWSARCGSPVYFLLLACFEFTADILSYAICLTYASPALSHALCLLRSPSLNVISFLLPSLCCFHCGLGLYAPSFCPDGSGDLLLFIFCLSDIFFSAASGLVMNIMRPLSYIEEGRTIRFIRMHPVIFPSTLAVAGQDLALHTFILNQTVFAFIYPHI
jgi:hypothetical protein